MLGLTLKNMICWQLEAEIELSLDSGWFKRPDLRVHALRTEAATKMTLRGLCHKILYSLSDICK